MSKQCLKNLAKLCAYSHIYALAVKAIRERELPGEARQGAMIALLGLFCPFFWIALFSGEEKSIILFHATHSGIVIMIGVVAMILGFAKAAKRDRNER